MSERWYPKVEPAAFMEFTGESASPPGGRANVISAEAEAPTGAAARHRRGATVRALARLVTGDHAIALADQAVVSATSFAVTILIARAAFSQELGTYAMANSLLVSSVAIQESLLALPYTINRLGSGRSSAKLAGASLVSGVLLAVVTSLVLAIATLALAALHAPPALAGAMGVLVVVVPFALLRDFGRRFSFAHLRMGQALAIDVAASLVQLATLGILAWSGQLSAVTACVAVGIGSAAAGLPWLYHSRRSFSVAGDTLLPTIVQGWRVGKWFFATQVTLSLQSYISYWLLALIAGVASTGAFVACMSIAVFSNPLTMGLGNILTPRSVHALQKGGVERLRREAGRDTLLLFVLMAAFTVLVAIAGEWVMDLLFDKPEYHGHGGVLVILSLALLASAVGMPASSALASMKQPRSVFWAGLVALVLTVVLVVAFVLMCGLLGAAFGFLTGNVAGAAARWMAFRSATSGSSAHGPIEAIRVAEEVVPNASNGRWRLLHRDRGCQADVFILARECAENEHPDRLVVKLFRSPETANAEIVRRQMQAMSHLHALLDGTIVHGWKIVVPKPLHFCESPLALVMTHAQGRKACVEMLGRRGGHTIPEVLVAAWEELWSRGETHGDMNVDNILFSDALRQIAFVDAGLPASQPCSSADAAARDLGYLLFDAVVQLKEWRAVLDVAPWRQRFAEQVIDAHLRTFPREDRPRLMRAILDCAETNIAALDTSWSPHGLWCLLVQRVARRRIEATLRRGICGQNNRIAGVRDALPQIDAIRGLPARDDTAAARAKTTERARRNSIMTIPFDPLACTRVLDTELEFYEDYAWCLDPFLTFETAAARLRAEIGRLGGAPADWRREEMATNVYLLACGLFDAVQEHLRGSSLRLPRKVAAMRIGRFARFSTEKLMGPQRCLRARRLRDWNDAWGNALVVFAGALTNYGKAGTDSATRAGAQMLRLLEHPQPASLRASILSIPSPFRRQDLSHHDVIALACNLVAALEDRNAPVMLVGLRTSGSYFVPLVRAVLEQAGFAKVVMLTIQPDKGPGPADFRGLRRAAASDYTAVVVDDSPHTAGTLLIAVRHCRQAGFAPGRVKVLAPTHPARQDWATSFPAGSVLTLTPDAWHKVVRMRPAAVEPRLAEYLAGLGVARVRVVVSPRADQFSAAAECSSRDLRVARLKKVFEALIETRDGRQETRFFLVKSVGWGWLGYHAFLCGYRLARHVPPMLGLRSGMLYVEWLPQSEADNDRRPREKRLLAAGEYVASRVRHLRLPRDPRKDHLPRRHDEGMNRLEDALRKAYGPLPVSALICPRLQRIIASTQCPVPTLIDGRMSRRKWLEGPNGLLKTDYEHHGMGKGELNLADPAYDLAETILDLELSRDEEAQLVDHYLEISGDNGVRSRLLMHKLIAGLSLMQATRKQLFSKPHDRQTQWSLHRDMMRAWSFLTVQAARGCGAHCPRATRGPGRGPIVALDIDGVIDRRLLGFPCTTAAGIEAISLLTTHGAQVVVNTARSVAEVREYCAAYGFVGGAAEHGAYVWDACKRVGRVLADEIELRQLADLRVLLRELPGVFLDERHQFSIRAFLYRDSRPGLITSLLGNGESEVSAPLPTLLMQALFAELGLDRLAFHNTSIDTTIVARASDKGTGLKALGKLLGVPYAETIAIGDSEPDLAAFRIAARSYAPSHIGCAREARLVGCRIASRPYMRGFLESVRHFLHPHGGTCPSCAAARDSVLGMQPWLLEPLRSADRSRGVNLLRAFADPGSAVNGLLR